MMTRPTVDDERRVLLSSRAQGWFRAELIDEPTRNRIRETARTSWKPSSLFSRLVFFALTLVCIGAFWALLDLTHIPFPGVISGLASIALAEFLIVRRRFFHIGPEEALYLGGLIALVTDFGVNDVDVALLFAAAAFLAGIRVGNDLFIVGAALLVGLYLSLKLESGGIAAGYCIALAVSSYALLTRPIARPSWARTLASMILILPPAAFLFLVAGASPRVSPVTRAGFAVLAFLFVAAGVRARFHSAILAGLILLGLVVWNLSAHLPWPGEAQLIGWGLLGLAIAIGVEQWLRRSRRGITARRLLDPEGFGLLEAASVGILGATSTAAQPDRTAQLETGEGQFGGGGATGRY
jgi:hypothetical protein